MDKKQPDIQPQPVPQAATGPLFPHVKVSVNIKGPGGNAFAVLGSVQTALEKAGHRDQVQPFLNEAMAGDYDELLATCAKWVTFKKTQ